MTTPSHLIPTSLKLDASLKDRLEKIGVAKQRKLHWLLKEAVQRYVEQEEQTEQFRQETLRRWTEAEAGKTVTHEAVMAWLDSWGTDKEGSRPA